jgi:hypothetical protein
MRTRVACWSLVAILVLTARLNFAQNTPASGKADPQAASDTGDSLAAAARRSKGQKNARAVKVVTNDDLEASSGPLPHLKMSDAENGEEVVAAIAKYKQNHTLEQTEDVIRRWYEECDEELAAAIKQNIDIRTLRETNTTNGYELCQQSQDYEKCEKRRRAEITGARHDQSEISRNNDHIVRIQHSLMNIRNGLLRMGLQYGWFQVRTTNNIDRF